MRSGGLLLGSVSNVRCGGLTREEEEGREKESRVREMDDGEVREGEDTSVKPHIRIHTPVAWKNTRRKSDPGPPCRGKMAEDGSRKTIWSNKQKTYPLALEAEKASVHLRSKGSCSSSDE